MSAGQRVGGEASTDARPPGSGDGGRRRQQHGGLLARGYSRTVVALRFVIVLLWLGLVALATVELPSLGETASGGGESFVSADDPHVRTEIESVRQFGFPLLARTAIVQHDPEGLSLAAQERIVRRAVALTQQEYEDVHPLRGALPLINHGFLPASEGGGDTAVTYLYTLPSSYANATRAAREFAEEEISQPGDGLVGVTGTIPARLEQRRTIADSVSTLHLTTLAAIAGVVALAFRSVVAPLIAIGTAALAFALIVRIAGWLGELVGIAIPSELEPVLLALVLGVVTDYSVFFLSGTLHALRCGAGRLAAARTATTDFAPIVTVAGFTVAAGSAALVVAEAQFFRGFGPGLALAVIVSVVVSVTLIPAVLAILGRFAFWPSRLPKGVHRNEPGDPRDPSADPALRAAAKRRSRARGVRLLTRRGVAATVAIGLIALLALAAVPLRDLRLGVSFVPSLPGDREASIASEVAQEGFADGILSPTELLVQGEGVGEDRQSLAALGRLVAAFPGVAGVLGPGQLPADLEEGVVRTEDGDAARWLVVFEDEPLGATAIGTLLDLEDQLPQLLDEAGLGDARAGLAGDTAVASSMVELLSDDMSRIIIAVLAVNLLILVMFLRALVAPLYLLLTSVLAVAASLGLATWLFQGVLGHDGLTFYVPFAAAVLLVALGSDYNIFGVGHIWNIARRMPLRDAIIEAVPRTAPAINVAAVTLAATFGLLAVVPLRPFRELAFVLAVGIVLDAVIIRTLLVPALLVLFGRSNWWPARAPRSDPRLVPETDALPPPPQR